MTSTQISIRNEVYEKLKKKKRPNESFSDIIERLLSGSSNIPAFMECYGIAHDPEEEIFFDAFEMGKRQIREAFKKRTEKQNQEN
jgi:predicted CopG family antitoxin